MNKPLSAEDIINYLGITSKQVMRYADLTNFKSLDELFGPHNFMIILVEWEKNFGHWVVLIKRSTSCYYYINSFGQRPDYESTTNNALLDVVTGNRRNTIRDLFEESGDPVLAWTDTKWQSDKTQICGRYVIFAVEQVARKGLDLHQYEDKMRELKEEWGSYDAGIMKSIKI